MQVQPYLFFEGRCEEAIEFYRKTLGAEVEMLMRFGESPDEVNCPGGGDVSAMKEKVMHACVRIGESRVFFSDGMCQGPPKFQGFSLSLTAPDESAADRLFAALGDGGQVLMPLEKTFFSPRFGMVADRFGVMWQVYVAPKDSN